MRDFIDVEQGRLLARQLLGIEEPIHTPERRGVVLHGRACFQDGILACGVPDDPAHARHPTGLYYIGGRGGRTDR